MSWSEIIRYVGITATLLLVAAFVLGFFKLNIKDRVKIHKWVAIGAVAFGLIHAGIIFYRMYFMNGLQKLLHP
jgi:hypothetical protein